MSRVEVAQQFATLEQFRTQLRTRLLAVERARDTPSAVLDSLEAAVEELSVAEEELRQEHEAVLHAQHDVEEHRYRYQELFDFAPDSYVVTDPAGIIPKPTGRRAGFFIERRGFWSENRSPSWWRPPNASGFVPC